MGLDAAVRAARTETAGAYTVDADGNVLETFRADDDGGDGYISEWGCPVAAVVVRAVGLRQLSRTPHPRCTRQRSSVRGRTRPAVPHR